METMKEIEDYKNYWIDTEGKVWSILRTGYKAGDVTEKPTLTEKRLLKSFLRSGYPSIGLHKNSIQKFYSIHRLMAQTFLPNPENKKHVAHSDGDKQNNNLNNIRWATPKENNADKRLHGTWQGGENAPHVKLNNQKVKLIRMMYEDFNWNMSKIGRLFNIHKGHIRSIVQYRSWQHITDKHILKA